MVTQPGKYTFVNYEEFCFWWMVETESETIPFNRGSILDTGPELQWNADDEVRVEAHDTKLIRFVKPSLLVKLPAMPERSVVYILAAEYTTKKNTFELTIAPFSTLGKAQEGLQNSLFDGYPYEKGAKFNCYCIMEHPVDELEPVGYYRTWRYSETGQFIPERSNTVKEE